jgi:hypothetical protein
VRFLKDLLFGWQMLGLISGVNLARARAAWKWAAEKRG